MIGDAEKALRELSEAPHSPGSPAAPPQKLNVEDASRFINRTDQQSIDSGGSILAEATARCRQIDSDCQLQCDRVEQALQNQLVQLQADCTNVRTGSPTNLYFILSRQASDAAAEQKQTFRRDAQKKKEQIMKEAQQRAATYKNEAQQLRSNVQSTTPIQLAPSESGTNVKNYIYPTPSANEGAPIQPLRAKSPKAPAPKQPHESK